MCKVTADTLKNVIEGANSNNLFMQCGAPNQIAFRPLPKGFASRCCRRNELGVWKEMWAQGKYMDFVNYYYNAVYAPHEDEFLRRTTFAVDENGSIMDYITAIRISEDMRIYTWTRWLYRRLSLPSWVNLAALICFGQNKKPPRT